MPQRHSSMDKHPSPNLFRFLLHPKHVLSNKNDPQTRFSHSPHKHYIQNPQFHQTTDSTSIINPNSTNHQNPQHMKNFEPNHKYKETKTKTKTGK